MVDTNTVAWRSHELRQFPMANEEAWRGDPYALPIPNPTMREASSISDLGCFYAIGEAWAHVVCHFLPPNPNVLDIGCSCGKLARFLYMNPNLRYIGVDIFWPSIQWCRRNFTFLAGDRFRFEHFDGISEIYNPGGMIRISEYRLPTDDQTIDMTVCASLFTHLLEPDCKHYLQEIHRVSKKGGQALISIHNEPPTGKRFSGNEARIDIEEAYFVELARQAGLQCKKVIGDIYGQQLILFERVA